MFAIIAVITDRENYMNVPSSIEILEVTNTVEEAKELLEEIIHQRTSEFEEDTHDQFNGMNCIYSSYEGKEYTITYKILPVERY